MNNFSLQRSEGATIREEDTSYAHVTIKEAEIFGSVCTGIKDNKISFKQDEYQSDLMKLETDTLQMY